MRILLFFGFFFCFSCEFIAQALNLARHSYVDEGRGLASINGKNFYVERILSNSVNDSANLVGINESGKIIFKKNFSYDQNNVAQNVHSTLNKRLIVYGLSSGCNVLKGSKNFVLKIDTNGVTQASTTSQYLVNGSLAKFNDFAEHTDSSFYFLSDSLLFHYTKNLQFISVLAHGLINAKAMTLTNNGNLMIHGKNLSLVTKNMEITPAGTLVNIQNGSLDLKYIRQALSGNYYGLATNGTIEKLTVLLQPVGNTSLTIAPTDFRAFTLRHDTIFFADVNTSNNPVYGMMDELLSVFYLSASVYRNIYPCAMTINKRNKINVLATATSSMGPANTFVSFFQFPRNGSFTTTPDIGVSGLLITNTLLFPLNSTYIPIYLDVTVSNYSNDTVKGFRLNTMEKQLACGFDFFHKQYHNHIPPNGSVIVQTGLINYPLSGTVTQTPGFLFSTNICLYTTVPGSKNDINIDNDHFCKPIALRVGLSENKADVNFVYVSPNPFSAQFKIRSDHQINAIKIYDVFGKLIRELYVGDFEVNVASGDMNNGIYLLKIETEKGIQIKKVVKN